MSGTGIGLGVYADDSGVKKLVQTLDSVPGAAERATRKSISEFEKMAKSIRAATSQMDDLVEKSKKPLASLGSVDAYVQLTNELKKTGNATREVLSVMRGFYKEFTQQEKALEKTT